MAAIKGSPKTGGRVKGSHNKKSLLVHELLENSGINLISMITEELPFLARPKKVDTLVALLPYVYPKLTSSEIHAEIEAIEVIIRDYTSKK